MSVGGVTNDATAPAGSTCRTPVGSPRPEPAPQLAAHGDSTCAGTPIHTGTTKVPPAHQAHRSWPPTRKRRWVGTMVSPKPTRRWPLGSHSLDICRSYPSTRSTGNPASAASPRGLHRLAAGQLPQHVPEQTPLLLGGHLLEPAAQLGLVGRIEVVDAAAQRLQLADALVQAGPHRAQPLGQVRPSGRSGCAR